MFIASLFVTPPWLPAIYLSVEFPTKMLPVETVAKFVLDEKDAPAVSDIANVLVTKSVN